VGPSSSRLLLWLAAAVLASRLVVIVYLRTWLGDAGAYEHETIARALVEGRGFSFYFFGDDLLPSSHQAPALPLLLAGAYKLFGVGSPLGKLAVEGVGALLGALTAWGVGFVALRWWGRRVMVLTVLGFLAYPAFLYMPTRIQAVNWSAAFLVLFLAAFVSLAHRPGSLRWALLAGVAGGLGVLGEPILAAPFGCCWLWLAWTEGRGATGTRMEDPRATGARREDRGATGGWRTRWRGPLVAMAAFGMVLSPWVVRSTVVHGGPTFVKSTFWYVFWQGNHLGASGTDKVRVDPGLGRELARLGPSGRSLELLLDQARAQAVSVDESLTEGELRELRGLPSEAARVRWFRERILEDLAADPGHYLRISVRRLWMLLWFDDTNPRSFVLAYRLPYLLLLALAVGGMTLLVRRRALHRGFGYWVAVVGSLLLVHTLVITSARFRLPLEVLYLLPAAFAVHGVLERVRRAPADGHTSSPEPSPSSGF
jgi:hypothetical protein